MGWYLSSSLVYGFPFDIEDGINETYEEEHGGSFQDALYTFLKEKGLTYAEGGYPGNQDEATIVIGIEKSFDNYVDDFSVGEMEKFVERAKKAFTDEKLQEVANFLELEEIPILTTYLVTSLS